MKQTKKQYKQTKIFKKKKITALTPKTESQTTVLKKMFKVGVGPYPSRSRPYKKTPRSFEKYVVLPFQGYYVQL